MKKFGFTLAETLITLGIIGIVAAMTIPNLITEHQKRASVTKLQRAISEINQAYRLSFDEVGEATKEEAFEMGVDEYFKKYWAPYIKVLNTCSSYQACGYKTAIPFKHPNRTISSWMVVDKSRRATFYTMDGFLYIIFIAANGETIAAAERKILVDINGSSAPNQFGKDVFILTRVEKDGGGVRPFGYEKTDEEIKNNCSKSYYNNIAGFMCAERIRRAGWKIDNNYPWK